MSDIKLVLTDFDGTVVQLHEHEVSERVREAVIACENKGVKVVSVTGRFFAHAQPVLELLGFDGPCIFDNGATIMHARTGEILWSKWLDAETVRQVASIVAPISLLTDYMPDHDVHEPADNELERVQQADQAASHVYARIMTKDVESVDQQLKQIKDVTYYFAPSSDGDPNHTGLQVNHVKADKFHGVAALCEMLGIDSRHTLAIGDGVNDLPLFQSASVKVAMGNAVGELKAAADYTVATVDDDGFAEAMDRFVLG